MSPLPAQKAAKPPRISRRLKQAIRLIVTGEAKHAKDAAEQVGMSVPHLYKQLKRPHIAAYRDACAKRALEELQVMALGRLRRLLVNSQSDHVVKDICLKVLAAQLEPGHGPQVSIAITPGYVIDLSGRSQEQEPGTIEGTVVNEPAGYIISTDGEAE